MSFLVALEESGVAAWIRESPSIWSYPFIIFLHSFGLSLVVGLSVMIDLAVLGFAPGMELAPMKKLFPIIAAAFWINLASGVLLAIADATTMLVSPIFWVKMGLIAFAVATVLLIKKQVFGGDASAHGPMPLRVSVLAIASLLLWTAAMTAGRLTAYLGPTPGVAGL